MTNVVYTFGVEFRSKGIAAANVSPVAELGWDAASPSGITGESLLILALADFAAQLPAEVLAQLELPDLFSKWAPTREKLFLALCSVWHDTALRTNVLGSYLGDVNQAGLCSLSGDALFQAVSKTRPRPGYQAALAGLLKNPHQPGFWPVVDFATNGAPLPQPDAAIMDQIIESLRLSAALERDVIEAQRLIVMASDFASRNRPVAVADGLFQQLLEVAAKACIRFRGVEIALGSDSDVLHLAAALVEGAWECSLVLGDMPATAARFASNLSRLIWNWPAIAGISRTAVTGIMRRLPLAQRQAFWPAVLTCRAWS